jgi:hypothetical protein
VCNTFHTGLLSTIFLKSETRKVAILPQLWCHYLLKNRSFIDPKSSSATHPGIISGELTPQVRQKTLLST